MFRRLALAWLLVGCLGGGARAQLAGGHCGTCGVSSCLGHGGVGVSGPIMGDTTGFAWGSGRTRNLGPGPGNPLPTRTALARLGLERAWFGYVPVGATESVMALSLAEDLLFAQTDRANLVAMDAESGQILWMANLGSPTAQAKPVSVNSNSVFATNANTLYQLDRGTGRVMRQFNLEDFATSPTGANEDYVLVGTNSGRVVAFQVRDRSKENPPGPSAGSFAFAWKSAATVTSRPIVSEKLVAFGSQDRRLFVATNSPARILYRFLTAGPITAGLAPYGSRTVLVPSRDNNLYAVDLFDPEDPKQIHWEFATGAPIDQEPLVSGDEVFVINSGGVIFSVDPKTGSPRWSRPTGGGKLLAMSPRRIYLLSPDGDLFLIDRETGDELASPRATRERAGLNLRNYNLFLTNNRNDRVYLGTKNGQVFSFRELGALTPQPLRVEKVPFGTLFGGEEDANGEATPPDAGDPGVLGPDMNNP